MGRTIASFATVLLLAPGLLVSGDILSQQPASRTQKSAYPFPGVPLPAQGHCPSVVAHPIEDEKVLVGTFPLAKGGRAVVDGDTIRVTGLDNTLRLVGIDTEETFRDAGRRTLARMDWKEYLKTIYAGTAPERPPKFATPMGEAAKEFTRRFFDGLTSVRLEYDAPLRTRGYYNRHLVHVLASKNGRWVNFNVEIVRQGLSPYFVKYGRCDRHHQAFMAAEKEARAASRGVWAKAAAYSCYPDYPARLRWWSERDRDLQTVRALRKNAKDLFVLGEDAEWKALLGLAGRKVRVAGVPGRPIRRGRLSLLPLSHRNRCDFMIVGPAEKVAALGLEKHAGSLVLVDGEVSLYKGRPQFQAETVTRVARVPHSR